MSEEEVVRDIARYYSCGELLKSPIIHLALWPASPDIYDPIYVYIRIGSCYFFFLILGQQRSCARLEEVTLCRICHFDNCRDNLLD